MKMKINKISYLVLIIFTILIVSKNVINRNEIITEKNKIQVTILNQVGYLKNENNNIYDGILSIPQINLKKGVYEKNDNRNNIEENVTIHELSDYPNKDNSNLILMAYSGTGKKAFFNNINKLNSDSLIEFYYKKTKYVYKIDNYYTAVIKDVSSVDRDKNKKTITLITCSQDDKNKLLVYIGYLIDEIKY